MEPRIFTLSEPIEYNGEMVARIEMKEPRGKHIKKLDLRNLDMEQLLLVASKVSGMPPKFFDEITASDCIEIAEVISDFLEGGRSTGKKPSE